MMLPEYPKVQLCSVSQSAPAGSAGAITPCPEDRPAPLDSRQMPSVVNGGAAGKLDAQKIAALRRNFHLLPTAANQLLLLQEGHPLLQRMPIVNLGKAPARGHETGAQIADVGAGVAAVVDQPQSRHLRLPETEVVGIGSLGGTHARQGHHRSISPLYRVAALAPVRVLGYRDQGDHREEEQVRRKDDNQDGHARPRRVKS